MQPSLSIVVPVYNVAQYVNRCINSIIANYRKDLEIILVDDGSSDNSGQICDRYSEKHSYIHTIHKPNGGLSSARKAGFAMSTGKYIWFVDGDDFIENYSVSEIIGRLENDNSQLCFIAYNTYALGTKYPQPCPYIDSIIQREKIIDSYIKPLLGYLPKEQININSFLWQRIMRRDLITESCFVHENEYFAEDTVFDLHYICEVDTISIIRRPLYNYVYNPHSLSNKVRENVWMMRKNLFIFLSKYCKENNITASPRILSAKLAGLLYCIQNYAKGNEDNFRRQYLLISQEEEFKSIIRIHPFSLDMRKQFRNYRLLQFLCKYCRPSLIYKFYNWRQTR